MNRFRTFTLSMFLAGILNALLVLVISMNPVSAQTLDGELLSASAGPTVSKGSFIYADIDTSGQRVFVLIKSGLWQYDLQDRTWTHLDSLKNRPADLTELEFGYNPVKNKIQLWTRGVGIIYDLEWQDYTFNRIDHSFNHRNQFGHYPFYDKTGTLHAFGGYGLWSWKNLLTFYNPKINEWNIQPVSSSSSFPDPRIPYTGAYNRFAHKLFIYGGEKPQAERQDDHYTTNIQQNDIWEYNFERNRWTQIGAFGVDSLQFHRASDLKRVDRTNMLASSAYSPLSNMWYLPYRRTNQTKDIIYFRAIDVTNGQIYNLFRINFGTSKQFIPTHFFYNTPTENLIFIGQDYLSNSDQYPVRIYQLTEKKVLAAINKPRANTSWLPWGIGFGLLLLIISLYLIFGKEISTQNKSENFSLDNLEACSWLTEDERRLITYLFHDKRFYETHEIEEQMWPSIENYDYRRRLRNDLIKSVNSKVRNHTTVHEKIITTQVDPTDRRKNLYGINPKFRE